MITSAPARQSLSRGQSLARLALAGIVVYVAIDVLLAFLRPEYSLIHNAESDYGRGSWFWVMDLNFLLRCALSLAVIAAVWQVGPHGRRLRAGLTLLAVWAVCSGLLAFFADDLEGEPQHGSGVVHLALAFVAFAAVAVGAIVVSASLKSDSDWGRAGTALFVLSLVGAVAFLLLGGALKHAHGPDGLYERIFLGVELLWFAVAAAHAAAGRTPVRTTS